MSDDTWYRMPRHAGIPFERDYVAPIGQLIPFTPTGSRSSRWGQIIASRVDEHGDCWVQVEPADPLGEADH